MKLDNIIYDVDTLGTAIQSDLINESTTFNAMYPSQTSTELVNVLAGYGSMLQYNMVSALANCYTDTAYSPTGIYQLAETLGNQLHGNISSQLTCNIKRADLEEQMEVVIPAGSIFNVEGLDFFNKEDVIFPRSDPRVYNVTLIQGTRNVTERIASGIAGERFYFAEDFACNTDLVSVTVKDEKWHIIDSFLPLNMSNLIDPSQAKSFVLRTDPDGKTYLKCGSGANATIPAAGSSIKITWISNQGATGNIMKSDASISLVTPIYYVTSTGKKVQLEVEVTSSSPANGGFDTQSLNTLKDSSPYIFASGHRAVRRNDYKALLLNKCGYQTCNVWGEYEQANLEGTYSKIMMNMVYYSGIKSFQKYDLQKIATLDFDIDSVNFYETYEISLNQEFTTLSKRFHEIDGFSNSVRGFLGSYNIELEAYDENNNVKSLIYADKQGTGILTLDYSDNKAVIEGITDEDKTTNYENNYIVDDLGPDLGYIIDEDVIKNYYNGKLYQYDDVVSVEIRGQDQTSQSRLDLFNTVGDSGESHKSPKWYNNGKSYLFSGTYDGVTTTLSPTTPAQILFTFNSNREVKNLSELESNQKNTVDFGVITGFIFKTPTEAYLENFIGSFAVYGTNANILEYEELSDSDSDVAAIINVKNNSKWTKLTDTITISDENLGPEQWTNWFTLNTFDTETGEWINYKYYLIEVYSYKNNLDIYSGKRLAIGEIRACYGNQTLNVKEIDGDNSRIIKTSVLPGRSSYIFYNNNNYATLRIPFDNQSVNNLAVPQTFQFYKYSVFIDGATVQNNYMANDVIDYVDEKSGYTFRIMVNNNINGECKISLIKPGGEPSSILNGQFYIEASDVPLEDREDSATISITSTSCTTLYANYLGNFYTNADIQKLDLPTIEKYNHFTTYLEFKQPKIKNIFVDISVEYENIVYRNDIKNKIINAINDLFKIKSFSLGSTFSVSDLWKTVSMVDGVKRLIVNAPTDNITALPYELIMLPSSNLTIREISNTPENGIRIKD